MANYPEERPKFDMNEAMLFCAKELVHKGFLDSFVPYCDILLDIANDLALVFDVYGGESKLTSLLALKRPYKYKHISLFDKWLFNLHEHARQPNKYSTRMWVAKHNIQPLYPVGTRLIANVDTLRDIKIGDILTIAEVFYEHARYLIDSDVDKHLHMVINYERIESSCILIQ